MNVTFKKLTGLGLATLLGSTVAACGAADTPPQTEAVAERASGEGEGEASEAQGEGEGEGTEVHEAGEGAEAGEEGEGEGEGGHHTMGALPVENRVAFMSGHVEAGLALYRAGASEQAAKHLLHPVSETHAAERAGMEALGFTPEVFASVSEALAVGKPAGEIEPMLQAAGANLKLMRQKAGGDPKAIVTFLMETLVEEYAVGVRGGAVTDPGEYQDAYGFAVVARQMAGDLDATQAAELVGALDALVAMWPEGGPLADATPTPVAEVTAQTSKVLLALSGM
ncbi:MAG: hypothetical protein ACON5B_18040 [Myxococcota bacterium]